MNQENTILANAPYPQKPDQPPMSLAPAMPSEGKKWCVAVALAALFTVGSAIYVMIVFKTLSSLMVWSFIAAAVASLLFATALSAGSISHFTGWPNMRLGYQKQIGVLAFWVALFYSITLPILYPEIYWYGFFNNFFSADFIFGLLAMLIFFAMVMINSKWVAPLVSFETIKFVLGLGFVGYAFLVIRAIFIEWPLWAEWLTGFAGYPPGRLVLSVIALVVLSLRVAVSVHKKLNPRSPRAPSTPK